ncbi:hypothetical protein BFV93_4730 [Alteromonas macleodii]|nr:hypothetical protein BFV93_4730 [Alteromonas macleodii]
MKYSAYLIFAGLCFVAASLSPGVIQMALGPLGAAYVGISILGFDRLAKLVKDNAATNSQTVNSKE